MRARNPAPDVGIPVVEKYAVETASTDELPIGSKYDGKVERRRVLESVPGPIDELLRVVDSVTGRESNRTCNPAIGESTRNRRGVRRFRAAEEQTTAHNGKPEARRRRPWCHLYRTGNRTVRTVRPTRHHRAVIASGAEYGHALEEEGMGLVGPVPSVWLQLEEGSVGPSGGVHRIGVGNLQLERNPLEPISVELGETGGRFPA